jgi:hypothetical protein
MTEATPGASAIHSPPLSPETAPAMMETLKANPDFMKRVEACEPEAFAEYNKLWRVAHNLPEAPPQAPATVVDIKPEADARIVAAMQQHAAALGRQGFSEQQQAEIIGRRPVTMQERQWHESQYELRRKDAAFMARWSAGDMEAIKIMRDHAIGKSLPIGSLQDIERWERS